MPEKLVQNVIVAVDDAGGLEKPRPPGFPDVLLPRFPVAHVENDEIVHNVQGYRRSAISCRLSAPGAKEMIQGAWLDRSS